MHIYSPILFAYEQFRRACQTRGCCLWVSHRPLESRSKLTGEVRGQLQGQLISEPSTQLSTHEGDLLEDVLLEEGDGAHEERDGDTGGDTPADERRAEGAEEPICVRSCARYFHSRHTRG